MDIETQAKYLSIIEEEFEGMKNMISDISERIIQYPVYTQLAFMKPLKSMIFEAWQDSLNEKDSFLNNFTGGDDAIKISDSDNSKK